MPHHQKPWLDHYPPQIPHSLDYPDLLVPDMLVQATQNLPDGIAIRYLGKSMTYDQLYHWAVACAYALRSIGVRRGDRVSLMLPNCPQYVIGYYGVLMAGGIVVQTNPLYTERELEYILNDSGAKVMIALDQVYPKLVKIKDKTQLEHTVMTSIKDYLPWFKKVLFPFVKGKQKMIVQIAYGKRILSLIDMLKKIRARIDTANLRRPVITSQKSDDVALIQYTGGTTGLPKGVMLTHRNLVVNTHQCRTWLYYSKYGGERSLAVVPFFHVYGMTVIMNFSIYMGSTMIILPQFQVRDVLKAIDTEKPTLFPGAPSIYTALLQHKRWKAFHVSSIKACLSGSAPLPSEVQQKFEQSTKGRLVEGYGLSETSPVTHAHLIWDRLPLKNSIGIPLPDTDAVILNTDTRQPVPTGEVGELAIKGPQVMQGYWQNEEETRSSFWKGWLLTGDLGYMDENGYFYIVGRKKELIISNGLNVYPRDVEDILYEHPAIDECAVIGVADANRGETVKAYIVFHQGMHATEEELHAFCAQQLAAYKIPKVFQFRHELPKSSMGKILKRVLKEEST